jgi:hypothetical protein
LQSLRPVRRVAELVVRRRVKPSREFVDTEVVILSSEDGGRATPLSALGYQGQYRPHIVLQPRQVRQAQIEMRDGMRHITNEYLGVAFWSGPDPIPVSTPFTLTMLLMYAPHSAYNTGPLTPKQFLRAATVKPG